MSLHEENESALLGCVLVDPALLDKAVALGVTADHFSVVHHREQWRFLCDLQLAGKGLSPEVIMAEAGKDLGRLGRMGTLASLFGHPQSTTLHFASLVSGLLEIHAKRRSWMLLNRATEGLKAGTATLDEVRELSEQAASVCAGEQRFSRSIADIDNEVEQQLKDALAGKKDEGLIHWGLPKVDKFMTPIERHEYVLIAARPSRGKSSLLIHLAGHNLKLGKRIVIWTLETSDKAVFIQMACQFAKVNWKERINWMPDEQKRFNEARQYIRGSKRLLIYDRDLTLDAIESRARLLASNFKPDAAFGDYLGLVRSKGKDIYERVSTVSKAMIPLRKSLDCPVIFGQQLKRQENERSEPTLGELRDSGQLEEDAARVVMPHWTESQYLDQQHRPYKFLQPKLRDGPTTAVNGITFHAPTTTWREEAANN